MSWTDERIERLKNMWAKGATASQIADELGGVSRNAVIGKAHRLGLEQRPSPVKAGEEKEARSPPPRLPLPPLRNPLPKPKRPSPLLRLPPRRLRQRRSPQTRRAPRRKCSIAR